VVGFGQQLGRQGEPIYSRKWNHDFVGMPVLEPMQQNRPTVSSAEVEAFIAGIIPRYKFLVALLEVLESTSVRLSVSKRPILDQSAACSMYAPAFENARNNHQRQQTPFASWT
jgi:hypothetical protein